MGWTDERIETLKTLWDKGYSASQIARKLGGVSRNAVIGKLHRMGWRRGPASAPSKPANVDAGGLRFRWTKERDDKLAAMFDRGIDDEAIAVALETTDWSVISRRKVLRLLRQRQPSKAAPSPLIAAAAPIPVSISAWAPLPGVEPIARFKAEPNHCKWPITVAGDEISHCCGAVATEGPYCKAHQRKSVADKQPDEVVKAKRRLWQSHAVKIHGRAA